MNFACYQPKDDTSARERETSMKNEQLRLLIGSPIILGFIRTHFRRCETGFQDARILVTTILFDDFIHHR